MQACTIRLIRAGGCCSQLTIALMEDSPSPWPNVVCQVRMGIWGLWYNCQLMVCAAMPCSLEKVSLA